MRSSIDRDGRDDCEREFCLLPDRGSYFIFKM